MRKIDKFIITNLHPKHTELPVHLWVLSSEANQKLKKGGYRMIMANSYECNYDFKNMALVSIDKENPKLLNCKKLNISDEDFQSVVEYIKKHYDTLVSHARGEMTDYEFMNSLFSDKK